MRDDRATNTVDQAAAYERERSIDARWDETEPGYRSNHIAQGCPCNCRVCVSARGRVAS